MKRKIDFNFLTDVIYPTHTKIITNLNPLPHEIPSFNLNILNKTDNKPYCFTPIMPGNSDYDFAINNFIKNDYSIIPLNHRLLIGNCWFYYELNSHKKYSIYAYCNGFENLNSQGKYPLLTAPFQISTHKKCKLHNDKYNKKFYTQVTILNDLRGEEYPNKKIIFNAYYAQTFVQGLKQIIYILNKVYMLILQYSNLPIETLILPQDLKSKFIRKKLKENFKKKYLKISENIILFEKSIQENLKVNVQLSY